MRSAVCLAMSLVCLIALASVASAQGNCSLQSAVGTHAAVLTGFISTPGGTVPYVALGTAKVDAEGVTTAKVTVVAPSGSWDQTSIGKVVVDPDCTITKYYPDLTEQGVILRNGEEIRIMLHTPLVTPMGPRVQTNVGYRMAPGASAPRCVPEMVTGTYAQYCTAWMVVGPGAFAPTGYLGRIAIDGEGHFTGSGTLTVGGQKLSMTYKNGVYSLNPDCTGAASFEFEGVPGLWTEKLVVFDQGKEMITITTSGQEIDTCRFTRIDR